MFIRRRFTVFQPVLLAAVILALGLAGCSPVDLPGAQNPEDLPPRAVLEAVDLLAEDLGVSREQIEIVGFERVDWPDACLGVHEVGKACAQVVTPGFQITLEVDGQRYEYHSNEEGSIIVQAPAMMTSPVSGGGNPGELAGTMWRLVSYGAPGAETAVIENTNVTLNFQENGQAGGLAGCNTFGAEYSVVGGVLAFESITQTLMACTQEGVMEQEAAYLQALVNGGRYEVAGDRLRIWYGEGQSVLNFAASAG